MTDKTFFDMFPGPGIILDMSIFEMRFHEQVTKAIANVLQCIVLPLP